MLKKLAAAAIPLLFLWMASSCAPITLPEREERSNTKEETCTGDACPGQSANDAKQVLAFFTTYFPDVSVTSDATYITLSSDGLPPHKSPYYPNSDPLWESFDTMGGTRHQNPNVIQAQNHVVKVPINPVAKGITITQAFVDRQATTSNEEYHGGLQGMCLDGVALFHGVAAPGDDIADEEFTFDRYEGHPQMSGVYHHHSGSPGPLEVLKTKGLITTTVLGQAEIELFGVMCDGTLVMGCTELDGSEPDSSDFDAQNGHAHDVSDATTKYFSNRYHTHVCRTKYTNHLYSPEIQYYQQCGSGTQQPPPQSGHEH